MDTLQLLSIVVGIDLGLYGIAAIFAGAWVKGNRVEKIEVEIAHLQVKTNKIDVLETKLDGLKEMLERVLKDK